MFLRFMKGINMIKWQPILNMSSLDIIAVFTRVIVFKTVCWHGKMNVDNGGVFWSTID